MGGNITVLLRKPNGEVKCTESWTNPLPKFITNLKLLKDNETHVNDYCNYQKKDIGIYPSYYGIVVIDMVNKIILDWQHYMHVGWIMVLAEPDHDKLVRLAALLSDKRFKSFDPLSFNKTPIKSLETVKDVIDQIESGNLAGIFHINMKPYKVETVKQCRETKNDVMNRIIELGFDISKEDRDKWNNYYEE